MNKELKEELSGCDYYSQFMKDTIRKLKKDGICYVFYEHQANTIKKCMNIPVEIIENDCGFTISIPRKYREVKKK